MSLPIIYACCKYYTFTTDLTPWSFDFYSFGLLKTHINPVCHLTVIKMCILSILCDTEKKHCLSAHVFLSYDLFLEIFAPSHLPKVI